MRPNMNNIEFEAIVVDYLGKTTDSKADFHRFHVADATGSIHMYLIGERGTFFKPMQILRVSGARVRMWHHQISIYVNKHGGRIVRIGEFRKLFSLAPNLSEMDWIKDPENPREWITLKSGSGDEVSKSLDSAHRRDHQQHSSSTARTAQVSSGGGGSSSNKNDPQKIMPNQPGPSVPHNQAVIAPSVMAPEMAAMLMQVVQQLNSITQFQGQLGSLPPETQMLHQQLVHPLQQAFYDASIGRVVMDPNLFQSISMLLSRLGVLPIINHPPLNPMPGAIYPAQQQQQQPMILQGQQLQPQSLNNTRGGHSRQQHGRGGQTGDRGGRQQQSKKPRHGHLSYADLG